MSNDQKSSQPQNQLQQPHFAQFMFQMQAHQPGMLQTMRHPGIVMPMFVPFQLFSMSPVMFHAAPWQPEMEMKSNGLDPTELARLPTWKHKSTKPKTEPEAKPEKDPDCNICLSDFEAEQDISTIPCFHLFHTSCLKPWLENHRECPSCKHEVHLM